MQNIFKNLNNLRNTFHYHYQIISLYRISPLFKIFRKQTVDFFFFFITNISLRKDLEI